MRSMIVALSFAALAAGALAHPALAAKSKMGCEIGKEVWNAGSGKCEPGTYTKTPGKSAKKTG
jgi:hypothetical protein